MQDITVHFCGGKDADSLLPYSGLCSLENEVMRDLRQAHRILHAELESSAGSCGLHFGPLNVCLGMPFVVCKACRSIGSALQDLHSVVYLPDLKKHTPNPDVEAGKLKICILTL